MIVKTIFSLFLRAERPRHDCRDWLRDEKGVLALALLAIFSITATLGTALITTNRASAGSELSANNYVKANYLAEAGGRYALPRIQEILAIGGDPSTLGFTNQSFALVGPGDSFLLNLSTDDPYNPSKYTLTSTGTLANGSASKTTKYDLPIPATILGFKTVGNFIYADQGAPNSGDTLDPDDWTVVGTAQLHSEPTASNPDRQALTLIPGPADGSGAAATLINAAWANNWSGLPFLSDTWAANDNLLSYAVQVKISLAERAGLMAGLSFRLTAQDESASGQATFYGVSYLYYDQNETRLPTFVPDPNLTDKSAYLILWKQLPDGTKTIAHKKKLSLADGIVNADSGDLSPMTTLVVNLVERYSQDAQGNYLDASGQPTTNRAAYTRFNQISVYLQNSSAYRPGEVSWNFSRFQPFTWDDSSGLDLCEGGGSCVRDASYTSANFAAREPAEIGIHSYGYGDANLADFAVLFPPLHPVVQYE